MTRARAEADGAGALRPTRSRTSRWMAGSRTTPWSVRPWPASNCGLTRATIGRRGASVVATGPRTRSSEMNDTSMTARSIGSGSVAAVSSRAFVRSIETTRGRGGAIRRAGRGPRRERRRGVAPRCSRTSVKPPVEAPTSRQTRPAGSIPNASSAAASLCPPRLTYGSGSVTASGRVRRDQVARLAVEAGRVAVPHPDLAGQDQRLRPAPRLGQAALDEQLVQPDARRLDSLVGSSRRRGAHPPIVAQPASPGLTRRQPRPYPAATSERPGVARNVSSASRTWAASPARRGAGRAGGRPRSRGRRTARPGCRRSGPATSR